MLKRSVFFNACDLGLGITAEFIKMFSFSFVVLKHMRLPPADLLLFAFDHGGRRFVDASLASLEGLRLPSLVSMYFFPLATADSEVSTKGGWTRGTLVAGKRHDHDGGYFCCLVGNGMEVHASMQAGYGRQDMLDS